MTEHFPLIRMETRARRERVAGHVVAAVERLEPRRLLNAAGFVDKIDNPLMPVIPGMRWVYRGNSDGEPVKNVITVQDYTVQIQGVTCNVVLDRVFTAGELSEKTHDFFAQDTSGNVMYMGEMSRDIENGKIISREGSWIAGLNGAMSGIIMEAAPKIGDVYTQEHLAGVAEDTGEVLALHAKARPPFGAFKNCLETQETSPLEPGVVEVKYYKAGIGLVQSHIVAGESEVLKLVEFTSA